MPTPVVIGTASTSATPCSGEPRGGEGFDKAAEGLERAGEKVESP